MPLSGVPGSNDFRKLEAMETLLPRTTRYSDWVSYLAARPKNLDTQVQVVFDCLTPTLVYYLVWSGSHSRSSYPPRDRSIIMQAGYFSGVISV